MFKMFKLNRDFKYKFRYHGYWGYNPRLVTLGLFFGEDSGDEMYNDLDFIEIVYVEEKPGLFTKYNLAKGKEWDGVEFVPLTRLTSDMEDEVKKANPDGFHVIAYQWHNGYWTKSKKFDVKTF